MPVLILLDHILEAIHRDLITTLSLRSILRLNYGIQLNISCNMDMGTNCESIWLKDTLQDSARNYEWCHMGISYIYDVLNTGIRYQLIEVMSVLIDQEENDFLEEKILLSVGFGSILTKNTSIKTRAAHISTAIATVMGQVIGTNER